MEVNGPSSKGGGSGRPSPGKSENQDYLRAALFIPIKSISILLILLIY